FLRRPTLVKEYRRRRYHIRKQGAACRSNSPRDGPSRIHSILSRGFGQNADEHKELDVPEDVCAPSGPVSACQSCLAPTNLPYSGRLGRKKWPLPLRTTAKMFSKN